MNSKTFLTFFVIACVIIVVNAQTTANPIQSLQGKASSVAATATRTSPAAPTMTGNAGLSLNSGFANTILMQVVLLGCAFIVIALLA